MPTWVVNGNCLTDWVCVLGFVLPTLHPLLLLLQCSWSIPSEAGRPPEPRDDLGRIGRAGGDIPRDLVLQRLGRGEGRCGDLGAIGHAREEVGAPLRLAGGGPHERGEDHEGGEQTAHAGLRGTGGGTSDAP